MLQKRYYRKNERTASHVAIKINYACDLRKLFPQNQNFNKSVKILAHKNICAVR